MIRIVSKSQCCGCAACMNVCPLKCISMREDNEGFHYPIVNKAICINCGLCEKVCPIIHPFKKSEQHIAYAAINNNDFIRIQSSSGGIFSLLAEKIIYNGGIVFGARFDDDWNVIHDYTDTIDGISKFRRSKYIQSKIGDCYKNVKCFLEQGRQVLFSGTPCQIAGLKKFLNKEYENLLAVEIVCHGVPSFKVWQKYLQINNKDALKSINFRSKTIGWKKYNLSFEYKDGIKKENPFWTDPYMNIFLLDMSLRPSCYNCPSKIFNSQSDITLADFWGIQFIDPSIDDDKGCSLIIINNKECINLIKELDCKLYAQDFNKVVRYNPSIMYSVQKPVNRKLFFLILNRFDFLFVYKFMKKTFIVNKLYKYFCRLL